MSATTIYCLTKPGTRTIRYIGKTDGSLKHRLVCHISDAKAGVKDFYSSRWIRKLQKTGQNPEIHELCQVPRDDFERFERAFIFVARHCGMRLTNITDGGEGVSGWGPTPETCARISSTKKGKKLSIEHCASLSAAQNTSGFVGVCRNRKKWRAYVRRSNVGTFSKIEDAVFARNLSIANLL